MGNVRNKRSVLPDLSTRAKRTACAGLALFFLFWGSALAQSESDTAALQAEESFSAPDFTGAARQVFALLNGERTRAGLPPLAWDNGLADAARRHSGLMARQGELTHQCSGEPDLRERLAAVPLEHSGENVAVDSGGAASAHDGLMHSPPHRANILDPGFDAVGIGVVQSGRLLWVTEDFAKQIARVSDRSAADIVAEAFVQTRSRAHLPPLEQVVVPKLSRIACAMGQKDRLDTASALDLAGAYGSTSYTASDPAVLPSDAVQLARMRAVRSFAVGVCFVRNSTYPSGTYWVALALFVR
jgi:hypothetical protein